jgi:hypothetical protein
VAKVAHTASLAVLLIVQPIKVLFFSGL